MRISDWSSDVCSSDLVYCIDGSCETIERIVNDEFKDAVTALHAMDEARGQFDPETLTLFRGTRNTCSSKVFGVLNCCKGKGFPLIRSEEHTSELQSLMRISYAFYFL